MRTISISDIAKRPSILGSLDNTVAIVNKKTNELKGVFISDQDLKYKEWYKRNKAGLEASQDDFKELFDDAVQELGERL